MLVSEHHLGSQVKLPVTVILSLYALFRIKFFQLTHLFYITVLSILFTKLSYPSHLSLAVLKPMALVLLEGDPLTIICSKVGSGVTSNLNELRVNINR